MKEYNDDFFTSNESKSKINRENLNQIRKIQNGG